MKKTLIFTIALVLVFGISSLGYTKNVEDLDVMTAKSYSMGGAFTGVADDVSAVLFNPAGLVESGFIGLQTSVGVNDLELDKLKELRNYIDDISGDISDKGSYQNLLDQMPEDTSFNFHGFAGANLKSVALSGNLSSSFETTGTDDIQIIENNTDITGTITFAQKLSSPPMDLGSLAYGFNIDMTQHRYNQYKFKSSDKELIDVTADGNSIGIDLGAMAKITDVFTVGAQLENIYATDYTLEGDKVTNTYNVVDDIWEETSEDFSGESRKSARNMRVGASLKVPVLGTTLAADLENLPPLSEDEDMFYHIGLEQNLILNLLSLRAGTYGLFDDVNGKDSAYTVGLGLNLTKFHLDLAVGSNDKFDDNMTGIISGRFKF